MSETREVQPGTKVRNTDGKTIKLTEPAIVVGIDVTPQKQQQNRHLLLTCSDEKCKAWQIENNGRVQKFRASGGTAKLDDANRPLPLCGLCNKMLTFGGEEVSPEQENG